MPLVEVPPVVEGEAVMMLVGEAGALGGGQRGCRQGWGRGVMPPDVSMIQS